MSATDLYRIFDSEGRLLYVGISAALGERVSQHRNGKNWWWQDVATIHVVHYETRDEARAQELAAIRTELPLHNIEGAVDVVVLVLAFSDGVSTTMRVEKSRFERWRAAADDAGMELEEWIAALANAAVAEARRS